MTDGAPDFLPDRTGWIRVFGVVQTLLGIATLGMLAFVLLGQLLALGMGGVAGGSMLAWSIAFSVAFYGGAGTFFTWTGVGAFRLRRWARSVMLVASILWLILGGLGTVALAIMTPHVIDKMPRSDPPMPEGMRPALIAVTIVFGGCCYVAIPGLLAYFYSRRSVRATFDRADPGPTWTDACPPTVLGLAAAFLISAMSSLCAAVFGAAIWFGEVVIGAPAALSVLVFAVTAAWASYGLYRMRPSGWWTALILVAVVGASTVISGLRTGRTEAEALFRHMGYDDRTLTLLDWMLDDFGGWMLFGAAGFLLLIPCLLLVRRHFH